MKRTLKLFTLTKHLCCRGLNRGFTIVEMVIYMAFMSVFLIVLTQIFVSSLDVQSESESVSSVEQDARFILAKLNDDILNADNINQPPAVGNTTTSLQLVNNGETRTYALNGDDITLTTDSGQASLNSNQTNVTDLSFLRLGNEDGKNTIRVTMTITSETIRTGVGAEVRQIQTTFGTR